MRKFAAVTLLLSLVACGGDDGPEIWIYTSIYPHVIEQIEPVLAERFPDVTFRWYQKGSEQVALRLATELEAGSTPCDLLLTSDPFYYAELRDAGHLLAYESPATKDVPERLKDPAHHFATVRIPLMVMGTSGTPKVGDKDVVSFQQLAHRDLAGLVTMGDPLKSGTNFTSVAVLSHLYGWGYFDALRKNDLLSAGGNSAVLQRLESGERKVGIILLENLLAARPTTRDEPYPVRTVFPEDGAIPIPSPAAILRYTAEPEIAKAVFDVFFSPEVQAAIVSGQMYSPLPGQAPPTGAPALDEIQVFDWTNEFLEKVRASRDDIKKRWRETMK
jgi:iron(III) transport system substrate-binding protein